MPTPLLHSAVGAAVARAALRDRLTAKAALLGALVAILPDFDLVPGVLIGHPIRFHHEVTHSIVFAAFAAFAACRLGWKEGF
ncbi:MAG: metal-dependent hydrolase, partial [Elusimicrobia bacterium]|nr:metal-dependent hydrolase [Elusimicrobiota bacterium]